MTGKTHILGGVVLSSSCAYAMAKYNLITPSLVDIAILTAAAGASALFCDIDEPNSTISKKLPLLSALFQTRRITKKIKTLDPFVSEKEKQQRKKEYRLSSHRGSTHSLTTFAIILAIFALIIIANILNASVNPTIYYLFSGILLGLLSHIGLDLISGRIPLFAPFNMKSYGICLIRTASILDVFAFRFCMIISLIGIGTRLLPLLS